MFYKDFKGSSRFSEKVQYKEVYHGLTPSEINAAKWNYANFEKIGDVSNFHRQLTPRQSVAKKDLITFHGYKKIENAFFLLFL